MKVQALSTYTYGRYPAFKAEESKQKQIGTATVSDKKNNTNKYIAGVVVLAAVLGGVIYRARKAGKATEIIKEAVDRKVKTFNAEKKFTKYGQELTLKYSRDNGKTVREIYDSENKLISKLEKETKFSKNDNGKRYIDIAKKQTESILERPMVTTQNYTKYYSKDGKLEAVLSSNKLFDGSLDEGKPLYEMKNYMLVQPNKKLDMKKVYNNDYTVFDNTYANVTMRKNGKRIGKLSLSENPMFDGKAVEKTGNYAFEYDGKGINPKQQTVVDLFEKLS